MEYWRWWVVHLWVEGIFEVFATVALAVIFSALGLVSKRTATAASLVATSLFMLGGVPGTLHHMYFSGTSTPVMAIGATFSALEVVPLILLGYEAWDAKNLCSKASCKPCVGFVPLVTWFLLSVPLLWPGRWFWVSCQAQGVAARSHTLQQKRRSTHILY